jgi:hypothetical protein
VFQSCMALFTKEHFLISVLCFLLLIFISWLTLLRLHDLCNLSPIAFQARLVLAFLLLWPTRGREP